MGFAVAEVRCIGCVEAVVRLGAPLTSRAAGRRENSPLTFGLRTCLFLLAYLLYFLSHRNSRALKAACLLFSYQMQVKHKTTLPPGRRAACTRGRRRRLPAPPPQIRFGPGESWKRRMRAVSQVWAKGGLEADWLLHCVGIVTL